MGSLVVPAIGDVEHDKPTLMDQVVVDAAKTHTLFMGADILVSFDKELHPVRNVVGSSWVLDINGREKFVSTKSPVPLKITPTLKLTEASATISGYKRVAAYSYENDPTVRLTRGLSQAASMNSDLTAMADNAQHTADTASNKALGGAADYATADNQFGDAAIMYTAQTAPGMTHLGKAAPGDPQLPNSPLDSTLLLSPAVVDAPGDVGGYFAGQRSAAAASQAQNGDEPGARLATTGLDAMDVEFEISSAKPLHDPYVVTTARFHTRGSKPGVVQDLVYAQGLNPIYPHPTHVHFVEEGFPFDYELLDFQLHIYDRGEEVATNISSKRVQLTRDEAFEYIKLDYVSSHGGETLPAMPAMGKLPSETPARLASGKYDKAFFTKVSKDGLAEEPYLDAACSRRIDDPFLETVVRGLRFKPALASGKPVEGVATLNLGKLQI